jgi:3-oxoacyl-(acyl-carrier-protein) synthase
MLKSEMVPPIAGFLGFDEELPAVVNSALNVSGVLELNKPLSFMANAFGFGGVNATLIVSRGGKVWL